MMHFYAPLLKTKSLMLATMYDKYQVHYWVHLQRTKNTKYIIVKSEMANTLFLNLARTHAKPSKFRLLAACKL